MYCRRTRQSGLSMGDWKENIGLSDNTDVVKIYTNSQAKEEWKAEAEAHGRSLSRHLYVIIKEAQYLQQEGELSFFDPPREPDETIEIRAEGLAELKNGTEEATSRISEQQDLIEELEKSVSADKSMNSFDRGLMRKVLEKDDTTLEELSEELLQRPGFRSWLESELERLLYRLGGGYHHTR